MVDIMINSDDMFDMLIYIYINSDINIDQFWRKTKFSCFWMRYVWYPKDYRCCFVIEIIVERQCSHTILLSIASKSQEHPSSLSTWFRSLSDLYPLKSLENPWKKRVFPMAFIPMAMAGFGPGDRPGCRPLPALGIPTPACRGCSFVPSHRSFRWSVRTPPPVSAWAQGAQGAGAEAEARCENGSRWIARKIYRKYRENIGKIPIFSINIGKMMEKKMMEIRNTCIQMYTNVNLSTFVSI